MLDVLLGGYLHQDWDLDYATADEAVLAFARDAPTKVSRACTELARLILVINGMTGQEAMDFLMREFGLYYYPPVRGETYAEWLRRIQRLLGCD